jgi:hypothetical protein
VGILSRKGWFSVLIAKVNHNDNRRKTCAGRAEQRVTKMEQNAGWRRKFALELGIARPDDS